MKHREKHPDLAVEGCFGCRISQIRISGSAMPTRGQVHDLNTKERNLDRDLDAYKRLRMSGAQPMEINGSARLEATAE